MKGHAFLETDVRHFLEILYIFRVMTLLTNLDVMSESVLKNSLTADLLKAACLVSEVASGFLTDSPFRFGNGRNQSVP